LKGKRLSPDTEFKRGTNPEKHWNWKGGVTNLNILIRNLVEMGNWRKAVFERDNYTCQECFSKKEIEAHHIIPFSLILKIYQIKSVSDAIKCILLWDISNGKTLCEKCHRHSRQAGGEYNGKNF
jgi:hypothetical protein